MQNRINPTYPYAFAVCGWSGAGKTTLIQQLIQSFRTRGLWVGAIKHDSHHLELDKEGKNTKLLWDSGVNALMAQDPTQTFIRLLRTPEAEGANPISQFHSSVDLIIVEGHKTTSLPKIWLEHPEKHEIPDSLNNVIEVLPRDRQIRFQRALSIIQEWLDRQWAGHSLAAGVLIGGQSRRMGQDKATLPWNNQSLAGHIVNTVATAIPQTILLGNQKFNDLPNVIQLPDAPSAQGPLAGILSAMRWQPDTTWFFTACDMPMINEEYIQWLLAQRKPGAWALIPVIGEEIHPLGGIYEPQMKNIFETNLRDGRLSLQSALNHPKVMKVPVPPALQSALMNCNTPEEWEGVQE